MNKKLKILAPTRYPWRFNSPRQSRHDISVRNFIPFNKISSKIEGITFFNPLPLQQFDLVHAFNRIPLGPTPFVIGFESHLPRSFGLEKTKYFEYLSKKLASNKCRKIIAISEFAKRQFIQQHKNRSWSDELMRKLEVRYPNVNIPSSPDKCSLNLKEGIQLVFVGNHFGRKGGSVAVRLAELAYKNQLPLHIDIISSFAVGAQSWIDPLRSTYFENDKKLLNTLPNISHHGELPNADVLSLIQQSHFLLLPTLSDTFGYSAIESMANFTPVIATAQGALPEFVQNNVNGFLLSLPNNSQGEWIYSGRSDRSTADYEKIFDNEITRITTESFKNISDIFNDSQNYQNLRSGARKTAENLFSSNAASLYWDRLYETAIES